MQKFTRVLAGLVGFAAIVALVVKAKRGGDAQRWVEPPADGWPPLREEPATASSTATAKSANSTRASAKKSASSKKTDATKAPSAKASAKKAPAKKAPAKKAASATKAPAKKSSAKKATAKATQAQLPGTAPADTSQPAWVDPVDGACPDGYPVKAKLASGIFHVPGGMNYPRVKPDRCFRDEAAALEAGLRPSKM